VRTLPTALVPMGVDPGDFPFPAPAPPERPPTVVFLANFRAHKGIFTLLDAWEEVARRDPRARLLLAGGGPDEAAVRRRVAGSPAAGSIELLRPVERHRIPKVLARADVSCQPAHGEPFGWRAVEAMACGLAVVATDAAGIASVVPDAAGRKVPVGDAGALADALVELLGDRELRAAAGTAGRRAVEQLYAWDRVIDTVEAVFERVAKGPP
jgi:glycosyltransferase involved in cell wall biosynthesis